MIHVIGDIIIDEYLLGSSTRLSPEAPIPVVDLKRKRYSLGGAGNVFMNVKSATEDVSLHGYTDDAHSYILKKIKPKGRIGECDLMPLKTRIVANDHMLVRVDTEEYIKETIIEDFFSIKNEYDIVVLSDYNKGTVKNPQSIITKSKRCIVDPKVSLDYYRNAYVLKPNKKEFEDYIGESNLSPKHLLVHARRARDDLNVDNLIVTLGSEGVLLVGDQIEHYPAISTEVSDVTGAGDTFTATLAICLWMNLPVYLAVRISNTMAGEAVKRHGTYLIDYNKLAEEIENEKIISNR